MYPQGDTDSKRKEKDVEFDSVSLQVRRIRKNIRSAADCKLRTLERSNLLQNMPHWIPTRELGLALLAPPRIQK